MTTTITETNQKPSPCCISHLFHKAALQSPNKVAVVHAGGGARIAREFHSIHETNQFSNDNSSEDSTPPKTPSLSTQSSYCYEGDECFTYSEIVSAVEALSVRLRSILDGADDPYLIKPVLDNIASDEPVSVHIPESSDSLKLTLQMSSKDQNTLIPRILGIYMEPSVEYIVAVLSVLRCGAAFMPLDPSWPSERILSTIASSKANLVIGHKGSVGGDCFHKLDELSWLLNVGCCPVLPISIKDCIQGQFDSVQLEWPCECARRSFCYLIYTSGSTGRPKGVCGTEVGLLNRFLWMQEQYPLHRNEFLLFKTPISFIDHLQEIFGSLLTTCMLVIPPLSELKENIFYVVDFLQMYAINRFIAVPSLLRAIIPVMQSPQYVKIQSSLKLLVVSGEVFQLALWQMLVDLLPNTAILNLYGSTEVAGDCTYFDCKRLWLILENETLETVPIGVPISNCYIRLGEGLNEGEMFVGGQCVAAGYFSYPSIVPLDSVELPEQSTFCCPTNENRNHYYVRTGDFARQLQSGDWLFLGRKDRLIKVNGQRIALDEIENILKEHPDLVDAAVVSAKGPEEIMLLEAYVIRKQNGDGDGDGILMSFIRNWMLGKLPWAMVPTRIFFRKSLPISSSGKVDYTLLAGSTFSDDVRNRIEELPSDDLIQIIQKVFCESLMVEKISIHDDFFEMGGNSVSAAYASYKLGINMKLLYMFPTPLKIQAALLRKTSDCSPLTYSYQSLDTTAPDGSLFPPVTSSISTSYGSKLHARSLHVVHGDNADHPSKYLKVDTNVCIDSDQVSPIRGRLQESGSIPMSCALSRCNKVMHGGESEGKGLCQTVSLKEIPRDKRGSMQELWKVYMESCVDASPLIVYKESDIYLFIGSHSCRFVSIDAKSGSVLWETKLQGRIECSAAILDDFSQVVVGCYQGNIYFLHFLNGDIGWNFQTGGEVKSQPLTDKRRHLVWCGSYDHNLYALDYKNYSCIYKVYCGGSIFGSPTIDESYGSQGISCDSIRLRCMGSAYELEMYMNPVNRDGSYASMCDSDMITCPLRWASLTKVHSPIIGFFYWILSEQVHEKLFVASTSGQMTAISLKGLPFATSWVQELEAPVFGSLLINYCNGNVICCLVNGSVLALDTNGSIIWKARTGGPIFAGPCISHTLPSQVLICSRDGSVYSFELESGDLLWEHDLGQPISSSAYIDENLQLASDASHLTDRLICVCTSSGSIHMLRVNMDASREMSKFGKDVVREFAKLELNGDIFSSPMMVGGRIYVGCRDDYVHCVMLDDLSS